MQDIRHEILQENCKTFSTFSKTLQDLHALTRILQDSHSKSSTLTYSPVQKQPKLHDSITGPDVSAVLQSENLMQAASEIFFTSLLFV